MHACGPMPPSVTSSRLGLGLGLGLGVGLGLGLGLGLRVVDAPGAAGGAVEGGQGL